MTGPCYTGIFTAARNFIPSKCSLCSRYIWRKIFAFGENLGRKEGRKKESRFSVFHLCFYNHRVLYVYTFGAGNN